jgi:hypothetical protein
MMHVESSPQRSPGKLRKFEAARSYGRKSFRELQHGKAEVVCAKLLESLIAA